MSSTFPSVAIIGTGALGGYYGGRLLQSGLDVHFLCHRDGSVIREQGLIVETAGRSITLHPAKAYDRVDDMPKCDVVIVALKTTANQFLTELLPPVVKPDGVVVVLQNGFDIEKVAAASVPGMLVLGGLCFLCSNKPSPGHIIQSDYDEIVLGWNTDTGDQKSADHWLSVVSDCLNQAHIKTTITPNLQLARWKKLVWNIPYNGMSVIHKTTTDVLMADPALRKEIETLMREVQTLAAACRYEIEDEFIDKMINDTLKMRPYKTSMLLDFEAGKPLELEAMYEKPLLAGEDAGASAPHIRALWESLKKV